MSTMLKFPILMGVAMGSMLPWMIHSFARIGAAFVVVHLAIAGVAILLGIAFPAVRRRLHRSSLAHMRPMIGAAAAGWSAICLYCLASGGVHWT